MWEIRGMGWLVIREMDWMAIRVMALAAIRVMVTKAIPRMVKETMHWPETLVMVMASLFLRASMFGPSTVGRWGPL